MCYCVDSINKGGKLSFPLCLPAIANEAVRLVYQLLGYTDHCWIKVKAIKIHHLVPSSNEVTHKLLLRIITGINFRNGSELRVRTEHEVGGTSSPLDLPRLGIPAVEEVLSDGRLFPLGVHVN